MKSMVLSIQNFPEGLVTFTAALSDATLGISIAIAIQNIPDGIAVAVPIFYATGSNKNSAETTHLLIKVWNFTSVSF